MLLNFIRVEVIFIFNGYINVCVIYLVLDGKMFFDKLLFIYYYDLYMNMYFKNF